MFAHFFFFPKCIKLYPIFEKLHENCTQKKKDYYYYVIMIQSHAIDYIRGNR